MEKAFVPKMTVGVAVWLLQRDCSREVASIDQRFRFEQPTAFGKTHYWQPVKVRVEAVVVPPAVTNKGLLLDVELVCTSAGEQSGILPLPGTTACASIA